MLTLDHIAITAPSLGAGRAYVEETLGLTLQRGGRHERYGTHNMLLGLEDGLYLEVIAIDPDAPPPPDPRWFDLDRRSARPQLGAWVCRTSDLSACIARFPHAGQAQSVERAHLVWEMAVPSNGQLPYHNCFPAIMTWVSTAHPAAALHPSHCRLTALVIRHPHAAALQAELKGYLSDDRLQFETGPQGIQALIDTPNRGVVPL